nr:unnamed protein product [Callosobruchus analis]CAI5835786.1 unnamed protein product [Callosobruchus analis]
MFSKAFLVLAFAFLVDQCHAGPVGFILSYGACQTACNAAYVVCCTAAGVTAGKMKYDCVYFCLWRKREKMASF